MIPTLLIDPNGNGPAKGKVAAFQHTTVTASDDIVIEGLTNIKAAVATFNTAPADANNNIACQFSGNTLTLKTYKHDGTDPTPVAATVFSKVVNVIVAGE